jgi:hypothetical protein
MRITAHALTPLLLSLASTCCWGQLLQNVNIPGQYAEAMKAPAETQRIQAETELLRQQTELLKTQNALAQMKQQALQNEQAEPLQIAARPTPTTESDQRSECAFIGTEFSRQNSLLQQISMLASDSVEAMLWQDAIQKNMAVLRTRFAQVRCDAVVNANSVAQSTPPLRETPVASSTPPAMAGDDANWQNLPWSYRLSGTLRTYPLTGRASISDPREPL